MKSKYVLFTSGSTAGLASLCCIGPIVFAGLGVTSIALGAQFETLRPYFLTLTGILLAVGFYVVYRKPMEQAACESGVCQTPRLTRWSKQGLWVVTVVVTLLAFFPNFYGKFRAEETSVAASPSDHLATVELRITGMSCEACAAGIESTLHEVAGVASANVSFEKKQATISYDPKWATPEQFAEAVTKAGYSLVK